MKTKEHDEEVKVIVVHNLEIGYKIISMRLSIQVSIVGSILKKWKLHYITQALFRQSPPTNTSVSWLFQSKTSGEKSTKIQKRKIFH